MLRKRVCRRLKGLGLAVREGWEVVRALLRESEAIITRGLRWGVWRMLSRG